MRNAFEEVERLYVVNAQHRKGWKLRNQTPRAIATHAREELRELAAEPLDLDELADVVGCLLSLAIAAGLNWRSIRSSAAFDAARTFDPGVASELVDRMLKAIEATNEAPPLSSVGLAFGFVYSYAASRDWSEEHIEQRLLVKLATRFVNQ